MNPYPALFTPLTIKHLEIRNRLLSTSHSPGYAVGGRITERYLRYQEEKARGGIGLTQFGGATAVSIENSFHYGQIDGAGDAVIPEYRAMAERIHAHGAACTVQLTHGGRRERWDSANWLPAYSASCRRELVHRSFPVEMEHHDVARAHRDYAQAVRRAREGRLDGVEISCQAGTLIEQFWSPAINHREDEYGGSLENRVRFGLELVEAVRREVGDDFIVGIRMSGDEMLEGGLSHEDCIEIAKAHAGHGGIDFISVVGAQATDYKASATIWPTMWMPSAPFLHLASAIRAAVDVPVFHATRITDAATAAHAVAEGHVDMIGMTRTFIADPHFANKLARGDEIEIRPCVGAGYCVDRVLSGQDALCVQNPATGREEKLPQIIAPSSGPRRRVLVVGGGPGGLEAARVSAERGHQVVLFEAAGELGGQILLAARATWRRELAGIAHWLAGRIERLGVDIRLNTLAEAADVRAESPDVVIVATGGLPNVGHFEGREHAATLWDVLGGQVEAGEEVLVFDENGSHQGPSCAEHLASRGSRVEIVTPDRALCTEMADTNQGAHLNELYRHGVAIRPDTRLAALRRDGNRLVATLANLFTGECEERTFDQVVGDYGTLPNDALYFELKPGSSNLGEVDLQAMADARPQSLCTNSEGRYQLFRVGDAWTSRNIHAAMLDSLRLCKDL